MTVSTDEFLRRFLTHVLPKGLVRIRHFGLFANRKRSASLLHCRLLLNAADPSAQPAPTARIKCPLCSEPMRVIEPFTSLQLLSAPQSTAPIKPRLDSS
jgi:Putative transposase